MIIEFIGAPGSGKTTASKLVADSLNLPFRMVDSLRFGHTSVNTRSAVNLERLTAALKHPGLILNDAIAAHRHSERAILGLSLKASRCSSKMKGVPQGVIDEGPRHAVCSFAQEHRSFDIEQWVPRLSMLMARPTVVVWVRCDPEIAWERFVKRYPSGHIQLRPKEAVFHRHQRYDHAAASLLHQLTTIQVNSTNKKAEELAAVIVDQLTRRSLNARSHL